MDRTPGRGLRLTLGTVGVALIAAAGLKLYGLAVSALPQAGWFSLPWLQALVVAWELVLGVWLLSGTHRVSAWAAALATFVGFAAVSGYLGLTGVTSCGCFGAIEASPWAALTVDIAAVVLLTFFRPGRKDFRRGEFVGVLSYGGGAVGVLAVAATASLWVYGSVEGGLARLRGLTLHAPGYTDFGVIQAGEPVTRNIEVQNLGSSEVRLIGGTSDCTCLATLDVPITIGPGESRAVRVRMKVPQAEPGRYTRTVEWQTDVREQPRVVLRVGCVVEE